MTTALKPLLANPDLLDSSDFGISPNETPPPHSGPGNPKRRRQRKKKKLKSQAMILIRRVHLYSGLFMLPWVLLYGFTALLFNHPTYMSGSNTQTESIALTNSQMNLLPSAAALAESALESAQRKLASTGSPQSLEIIDPGNAVFTRRSSGSIENEHQSVTVVLDLNTGKGYLTKRQKPPKEATSSGESKSRSSGEANLNSLDNGLPLTLQSDPVQAFKNSVGELLIPIGQDPEKLNVRGFPNVEFDALVDGTRRRLRFTPQSQRYRRGGAPAAPPQPPQSSNRPNQPNGSPPTPKRNGKLNGKLSIVGANPRELTARRFLLRLHMARGYPTQTNARWFWAIAVDLMFASMMFWGVSGVFMWWQIKRTRRFGFALLVVSAAAAIWLAIGMHSQIVNG